MTSKELIKFTGFLSKMRSMRNWHIFSGFVDDPKLKLGKCSLFGWRTKENYYYGLIYSIDVRGFYFSQKGINYNEEYTIGFEGEVIKPLRQDELKLLPKEVKDAMIRVADNRKTEHVNVLGRW